MRHVVPRRLTSAERARQLPAAIRELLERASRTTTEERMALYDRIVELVDHKDDDERERILVLAVEQLRLPRE